MRVSIVLFFWLAIVATTLLFNTIVIYVCLTEVLGVVLDHKVDITLLESLALVLIIYVSTGRIKWSISFDFFKHLSEKSL
ncbi:MAG: hypothetical protein ACI9O6_000919 [Glaciecola sp.]|jgi:hypothetical protein